MKKHILIPVLSLSLSLRGAQQHEFQHERSQSMMVQRTTPVPNYDLVEEADEIKTELTPYATVGSESHKQAFEFYNKEATAPENQGFSGWCRRTFTGSKQRRAEKILRREEKRIVGTFFEFFENYHGKEEVAPMKEEILEQLEKTHVFQEPIKSFLEVGEWGQEEYVQKFWEQEMGKMDEHNRRVCYGYVEYYENLNQIGQMFSPYHKTIRAENIHEVEAFMKAGKLKTTLATVVQGLAIIPIGMIATGVALFGSREANATVVEKCNSKISFIWTCGVGTEKKIKRDYAKVTLGTVAVAVAYTVATAIAGGLGVGATATAVLTVAVGSGVIAGVGGATWWCLDKAGYGLTVKMIVNAIVLFLTFSALFGLIKPMVKRLKKEQDKKRRRIAKAKAERRKKGHLTQLVLDGKDIAVRLANEKLERSKN